MAAYCQSSIQVISYVHDSDRLYVLVQIGTGKKKKTSTIVSGTEEKKKKCNPQQKKKKSFSFLACASSK